MPGALDLSRPVEDDDHVFHPYLNNDLGHFFERGGTYAWSGLSSTPSEAATKTLFNANGDCISILNSNFSGTTATLTLTNLPKGLSYSAYTGVVFGYSDFAPTGMSIETSTNGGTSWTTRLTDSSQKSTYLTTFDSGASSTNAIRYTFNKNNGGVRTSFRIQSITAYNYNSAGMENYFLPLDGGTIYGNTLLNSTSQLQFGDSGTYIHQSADGVLDLVADTELELNGGAVDINATNGDINIGAIGGNVAISGDTSSMTLTNTGTGNITICLLYTSDAADE